MDGALKTTYDPGTVVDSGVKLTVTPTINTESNITVEIKPEIVRILDQSEWTTAPDGSSYPAISKKEITTVFSLLSGETAAIGGLTETDKSDAEDKIPILGDIPLIGEYLFSHSTKSKAQTETIIFVTVGLAKPEAIENNVGVPTGARLVHQQLIQDAADQKAEQEKLSQMEDQSKQREEDAERRKQFMLDRTR